jgi:hypothetical protein
MSLEFSASLWDGISFWLVAVGTALAFLGAITAIQARRLNRALATERSDIAKREKDANDKVIAEANARAREAEARAAEANLELAKFRAPRTLTPEQRQRIIGKLNKYAGQTFSLNVYNDPEALLLLRIITDILKSAGWVEIPSQLGDVSIGNAGMVTEVGVKVEVPQNAGADLIERVKALNAALNAEGISSLPRYDPQLKNPSAINVMVGKKL